MAEARTACNGRAMILTNNSDTWTVAGRALESRLIVGTGKYRDLEETAAAIEASGAEIVTVAVRRVNVTDPSAPMLMDYVDPKKYVYLPNTAGCFTADDALRTLRLAREAGGWSLVKLEVLGDEKTLYPNMEETVTKYLPYIGNIQIADVPGRGEPGTGDIDYDSFLSTLDRIGYEKWVALEYVPTGDTVETLQWMEKWR